MFSKSLRLSAYIAVALLPLEVAASDIATDDLLSMSLKDLADLEVTSVSKKAEKASEAAAAIFVVTQEDIQRSGATNIPEALRMVPGVDVAQSGSHEWAVTSRGFNSQFSNKLLVLIDGRTIYSPLFSGVVWQLQDVLLEDVERIEVIRGPGATLWGVNAVNGVINIITKNSKDSQGALLAASAGNQLANGGGRYGAKLGDESYMRAYAKYDDYDSAYAPGAGRAGDGWQKRQAGFRTDSKLTEQDNLTVQGDLYDTNGDISQIFPGLSFPYVFTSDDEIKASGGNVLSRWTRDISPQSSITTQAYIDTTQYKTSIIAYNTMTVDFDFQHTWTGWNGHEVIWGAGYRRIGDHNGVTSLFSLTPTERSDNVYNAFLQDKIGLSDDVFLTLGSKFEKNDYTGVEIQPSARMSWLINDKQTLWGSVSRAVHTPSRYTDDGQLSFAALPPTAVIPLPTLVAGVGNKNVDSEELIAYELGYRIQPADNLSLDFAAFYNDYDNLFRDTLGAPSIGSVVFVPVVAQNANAASSLGLELSAKWDVTPRWQMVGAYSYLDLSFDDKDGGISSSFVGKQPKHKFSVISTYLFSNNLEMTNALYYVDELSGINIPSYYRFDSKLSYEIQKGLEVSIVGHNLLDQRHREFAPFLYQSQAEIGRSVFGKVTWQF